MKRFVDLSHTIMDGITNLVALPNECFSVVAPQIQGVGTVSVRALARLD